MWKAYFQRAAEPLFNSSHVDSDFSMEAVFPGCLKATAFMNALLYSIVQAANFGHVSVEGLKLQGKALRHLSRSLTTPGSCPTYSDIGAMMVLQGVAVRHTTAGQWNLCAC